MSECNPVNGYSLDAVNAIETACYNTDLGDDTVAVVADHEDLDCGDRIYIHGLNPSDQQTGTIKRVTDNGDLAANQCDNYNPSDHRCSLETVDLGNFFTIKLF